MLQLTENPDRSAWPALTQRPYASLAELEPRVREILSAVQRGGDAALLQYTHQLDGAQLTQPVMPAAELEACAAATPPELRQALEHAYANLVAFHAAQRHPDERLETQPGVLCWRRSIPLQRVGLYVPGGSAPLFSTLLMLGVPAQLAGCPLVQVATPPGKDGRIHPGIAWAAQLVGAHQVVLAGGAQAVAALAYGTETVAPVDKIFGPGNAWVTAAKQLVSLQGTAIDMPAGPSEVMVVADHTAHPAAVAADLLSQAEHGPDSQVVLLTPSTQVAHAVSQAVEAQLATLPRADLARQSLAHSHAVVMASPADLVDFMNAYAAEHLILNTADADELATRVVHAGSVFVGPWAAESVGDYASGTNHSLPTAGWARAYAGVSLDSFMRRTTFQQLTPQGLRGLATTVTTLARAEGLEAHARAVEIRLNLPTP